MISLEKNYAKTIVKMSRPDIFSALRDKLLTYPSASSSVERSFFILKSITHEFRNFNNANVAFYYEIVFNS